ADGRAARRARQVFAGAGRADAQESADGAAARSQHVADAEPARPAEHDRQAGAGQPGGARSREGPRQAAAVARAHIARGGRRDAARDAVEGSGPAATVSQAPDRPVAEIAAEPTMQTQLASTP